MNLFLDIYNLLFVSHSGLTVDSVVLLSLVKLQNPIYT